MREHCCCDPLTAALITARCSVSTLGVNTWEHQPCGDLAIHKHVHMRTRARTHTHTHRQVRSLMHTAFICISRLPPNMHFPRLPSVSLKTKHGLTALSSLVAQRRRQTTHMHTHSYLSGLATLYLKSSDGDNLAPSIIWAYPAQRYLHSTLWVSRSEKKFVTCSHSNTSSILLN